MLAQAARAWPGVQCRRAESAEAELARLESKGYRVVVGPKPGADGKRIAFLHPGDAAKVLIELCADA